MASVFVVGLVLVVAFVVATRLMAGDEGRDRRPPQDSTGTGYASTDGGYSDSDRHDNTHDATEDGASGDSGGGDGGGGDGGGGDGGGGGD